MVRMRWSVLAAGAACAALLCSQPAPRDAVDDLRAAFAHPPDDCRIMMRWWWFGPAVEKPELERELRTMKDGGIGGVEIQPVYPVTLDDPARGLVNLPYLSDGFLDAVSFANDKARELGMRVDITLGSGWPYGGPHTPIDLASARLRVERRPVPANAGTLRMPKIGQGEKFIAAFIERGHGFDRITNIDDAGMHVVEERAGQMRGVLGAGSVATRNEPPWWGAAPGGAGPGGGGQGGTLIRIAFWAAALCSVLEAIDAAAGAAGLDPAVAGSAAAGVLHASVRPDAPPGAVAAFLGGLREALARGKPGAAAGEGPPTRGSAGVLHAPGDVREVVDLWGPVPGLDLMRAVKEQFDPGHLMSPGRLDRKSVV